MRAWFRRRPWIWLVVLYLFVVGVHAVVVWIAERHPVIPAEDAPPPRPGEGAPKGGGKATRP